MYEGYVAMNSLAAGCIAALFAFAANRLTYTIWRNSVIIGAVPLTEEVAKTMTAHLFRAHLFSTHVVFGLIEGLFDWYGGKRRLHAALSAVAAHSFFGWVTARVASETGMLGAGILAGILMHTVWNATLLFCTEKR